MTNNIDEKVEVDKVAKLPQKRQQEFYDELERIVGNKHWFEQRFGHFWHRVYSNTEKYMLEIKEMLFREYEKYLPGMCGGEGSCDLQNYRGLFNS